MTSQQQEQIEEMIQRMELSMPEAEVLRLLAAELEEFDLESLEELFKSMVITVGFTIDQLDVLLDEFINERDDTTKTSELIGWKFKYVKPTPNTTPLIKDIKIIRMDLTVIGTTATFSDTPLTFITDPVSGVTTPATITPKVFFQRREVETDAMDVPYPEAYDETLPRVIELPELPMYTLEGYYPWADLAMLQRGDLDNFADFILRGNTAYTDLFLSGANMEYSTMHNPRMRLEQINLKDSVTKLPVPDSENHRPFTLKAEPYIAAETLTKEWLRQQAPSDSTPGTGDGPILGEDENNTGIAQAAAAASIPMAAHFLPCPTIWDFGSQLSLNAARIIGATDSAIPIAFQEGLMARLYNPTPNPEPIIISENKLEDIPGTNDGTLSPQKPGCLSFLPLLFFALLIIWGVW